MERDRSLTERQSMSSSGSWMPSFLGLWPSSNPLLGHDTRERKNHQAEARLPLVRVMARQVAIVHVLTERGLVQDDSSYSVAEYVKCFLDQARRCGARADH